MTYRPDIDGLRAIAILFVLIFHSGLKLLPSGFIGVDIFFVISGFLITSIIHGSLQKGQFSFFDFYSRRLWRLQPVLICLLLITTIVTLWYYLPDDLIIFSNSARKSSLFLANKYFAKITTDYFAQNSNELALLHIWSLSVEWQCYLVLPFVIYFFHTFFPKHITKIIGILTLLFYMLTLYYSAHQPGKTYFLFSSRIFEFLIGSCVALYKPRLTFNRYFLESINLLAVIVLIYIACIDKKINYDFPNWYALALCLATGAIIASGNYHPKLLVTRILATKPFVFIGLISYSLYLWHWPLFALMHYQNLQETTGMILFVLGISLILAYLSWRFIEKPARKFNRMLFGYSFAFLIIIPIISTHLMAFVVKKNEGLPNRFNAELVAIYDQLNQYSSAQRPKCIGRKNIDVDSECWIGSKNADAKKALMIGDSYSNHYWGFMDTLAKQANVSVLAQATSACLTLPGIFLFDWWYFDNIVYQECHDDTEHYFSMIAQNHYDYVLIGQVWRNYLNDKIINQLGDAQSEELAKERIAIALDSALRKISAAGSTPVLIKGTPSTTVNLHDCFFKHIKQRKAYQPEECNFAFMDNRELWFDELFAKMKTKYPTLIIIDPVKVLCPQGICQADIKGVPIYRDFGHITDYASYQLADLYLQQFTNPLKEALAPTGANA